MAEGIETPAQMEMLKALGCEEGQGYLMSKPVPVAKIPALISKWTDAKVRAA